MTGPHFVNARGDEYPLSERTLKMVEVVYAMSGRMKQRRNHKLLLHVHWHKDHGDSVACEHSESYGGDNLNELISETFGGSGFNLRGPKAA